MRTTLLCTALLLTSTSLTFADHGISTWGTLKYPADFKHFYYTNPNASQEGEVTHSALGTFDSLNMYIVKGTPAAGLGETIATLLAPSYDEINTAYGYVAQDVSISEDKLTVTFTLNPHATFSDNTKITAADVVFSFNALREHGMPMMRSYYKDVAKVEAIGEDKVVFTLKTTKNKELPVILGQLPVFSKAYFEKHKFGETYLTPPPCSGPYTIEAIDVGRSITYVKRENWWGNNLPSQKGSHNFKRIRYIYYRDMNAMFEAFKAGDTDIRAEHSARTWFTGYDFAAAKDGRVKKEAINHKMPTGTYGLFFNIRRDVFKERDVRKALAILFDFAWANKNLFYESYKRNLSYFPNSDFIAEGTLSSEQEDLLKKAGLKTISDDLKGAFSLPTFTSEPEKRKVIEEALALLKTQGYEIKDKNLVDQKGNQLSFEILIYDRMWERVMSNFLETLKRIGVDVRLRLMDVASYQERVDNIDFDMIIGGIPQSNSPGNELRDYFGSGDVKAKGTRNYAGIQDPVVDALIEQVVAAENFESLKTTMRVLDRVLLNGYYIIPAWHQAHVNLAYWDKFERPKISPVYNPVAFETWYMKAKAAAPTQEEQKSTVLSSVWTWIKGLFTKAS